LIGGINLNIYALNNPLKYVDPKGLDNATGQFNYEALKIEPVFIKDRWTGEEICLGYNDTETLRRLELLKALQTNSLAEQIGDTASYFALGFNVANLGATVTGSIPAAETLGAIAAGADVVALISYTMAGKQQKAVFAFISIGVDLVPVAAVSLKPAYNPAAKRFIHASTKRFIKTSIGKVKYAAYPAANVSVSGAVIVTAEFEKEILKYLDY
jgi:hypothetical protein